MTDNVLDAIDVSNAPSDPPATLEYIEEKVRAALDEILSFYPATMHDRLRPLFAEMKAEIIESVKDKPIRMTRHDAQLLQGIVPLIWAGTSALREKAENAGHEKAFSALGDVLTERLRVRAEAELPAGRLVTDAQRDTLFRLVKTAFTELIAEDVDRIIAEAVRAGKVGVFDLPTLYEWSALFGAGKDRRRVTVTPQKRDKEREFAVIRAKYPVGSRYRRKPANASLDLEMLDAPVRQGPGETMAEALLRSVAENLPTPHHAAAFQANLAMLKTRRGPGGTAKWSAAEGCRLLGLDPRQSSNRERFREWTAWSVCDALITWSLPEERDGKRTWRTFESPLLTVDNPEHKNLIRFGNRDRGPIPKERTPLVQPGAAIREAMFRAGFRIAVPLDVLKLYGKVDPEAPALYLALLMLAKAASHRGERGPFSEAVDEVFNAAGIGTVEWIEEQRGRAIERLGKLLAALRERGFLTLGEIAGDRVEWAFPTEGENALTEPGRELLQIADRSRKRLPAGG